MSNRSVTVITASYNSQKYLRDTVESVARQTSMPYEQLIIDDCSTDDSLSLAMELAKEFAHVRVIRHSENKGFPAALNSGIAASTTKYIAILDSDDIALPTWLEQTTAILDVNLNVGLVGGGCVIMTEDGQSTNQLMYCNNQGIVTQDILNGYYAILHPGSLHRAEVIKKVGGYREDLKSLEDNDMYISVASISDIYHTGNPLILYRKMKSSESRKTVEYKQQMDLYISEKIRLLKMGMSIFEVNTKLMNLSESLKTIPRLQPLPNGFYEREMAESFWIGGKHRSAFYYYWLAIKSGYSKYLVSKTITKKILTNIGKRFSFKR